MIVECARAERRSMYMKRKTIFLLLSAISLSSCSSANDESQRKVAELPFTEEYGFASQKVYQGKSGSYEFGSLIVDALKEEGLSNPNLFTQMHNSAFKAYGDSMYFFYKVNNNEELFHAAIKVNVLTKKVDVMDIFSAQSLIDKGYFEGEIKDTSIMAYVIDEFDDEISFRLSCFGNRQIQYTYDPVTLEKTHEGEYVADPDYDPKAINDEYSVKDGSTIYKLYGNEALVTVDKEGNEWDVVATLRENDTFKQIQEIYEEVDFGTYYYILDGELYFEILYDNTSLLNLNPTVTCAMVWKADLDNQEVEYLGYLPYGNQLFGIFKL